MRWFRQGRNRHRFTERLHDNLRVASTLDNISAAVEALRPLATKGGQRGFAVRVRRRDKRFPLASSRMEAYLGGRILAELDGLRVDLGAPDVTLTVGIDRKGTYVSEVGTRG
ncbi:THUMP domain-containing protein [Streptomyces clavuligerus]|uniref:THUMP domain-containing protein n=1 Tax=Streptomyces clavuligerus TaxID=1901 RepID=UPI0002F88362|nr:THUMP domain-containing protein [Streptomyces clavuligerus]